MADLKVVALGGGHGLAASLSALRLMASHLTAVVTVADDGGSSGRIREEMDVLPPGDLRMALAALCDDSVRGRTWRDILQHRFTSTGPLNQHAVGNLLIVAIWQHLNDAVQGLEFVGELLGAQGRVLPMSTSPLMIEADLADDEGVRTVRGQANVATAPGEVVGVRLVPGSPPASPQAIEAIMDADWVILGPGSWFTSVIPHLLVPDLAHALRTTSARRCLTLNLSAERIETAGMSAADHVRAWRTYAGEMAFDVVLADPSAIEHVAELENEVALLGARLMIRQVRVGDGAARHDPLRLAAAYRDVFENFIAGVSDAPTA